MEYIDILKIVDTLYPVENLFPEAGKGRNIRCPFHGRDSKPSAHIYPNGLHCFTCGKTYKATKIAKVFDISPVTLYNELLEQYGGEDKLIEEYDLKKDILSDLEVTVRPHFENEDISKYIMDYFHRDDEEIEDAGSGNST